MRDFEGTLGRYEISGVSFGKDFRRGPYINYTCITFILTLFEKRTEFE